MGPILLDACDRRVKRTTGNALSPTEGSERESAPSFRGDAKHRTMVRSCAPENLEIPGLVLSDRPGMTSPIGGRCHDPFFCPDSCAPALLGGVLELIVGRRIALL